MIYASMPRCAVIEALASRVRARSSKDGRAPLTLTGWPVFCTRVSSWFRASSSSLTPVTASLRLLPASDGRSSVTGTSTARCDARCCVALLGGIATLRRSDARLHCFPLKPLHPAKIDAPEPREAGWKSRESWLSPDSASPKHRALHSIRPVSRFGSENSLTDCSPHSTRAVACESPEAVISCTPPREDCP